MPADLPSLERLTADVGTAMRAAEQAERAAAARSRGRWWRRMPPPAALLAALVLAASALALHATAGKGAERPLPGGAVRCDAAHVVTITAAAAATAAAALSRRDGRPGPTPSRRPCA